MDLSGTELLVLSACDTGAGRIEAWEGVYGLRRAAAIAGARAQVVTLWKVNAAATHQLMEGYYERLVAGEPRGEARRQVQLKFLKSPGRSASMVWRSAVAKGLEKVRLIAPNRLVRPVPTGSRAVTTDVSVTRCHTRVSSHRQTALAP